jgi:hypothetical protein
LGSITYFKSHGGVLHSPKKVLKEHITLMNIFYKHHGLNYFGLGFWRGIAYARNYSMHMQYPY